MSGLPGSGKSTLARQLAPALGLPLIDKDDILERLFHEHGAGDANWRRALSRESDRLFQAEALVSGGAVLVSHWHQPGMAADSGTPSGWLAELPGAIVHVHCCCAPDLAAERFLRRRRHPGHLDSGKPVERVRTEIEALTRLGRVECGPCVEVDTTGEPELERVLRDVDTAFLGSTRFGKRMRLR